MGCCWKVCGNAEAGAQIFLSRGARSKASHAWWWCSWRFSWLSKWLRGKRLWTRNEAKLSPQTESKVSSSSSTSNECARFFVFLRPIWVHKSSSSKVECFKSKCAGSSKIHFATQGILLVWLPQIVGKKVEMPTTWFPGIDFLDSNYLAPPTRRLEIWDKGLFLLLTLLVSTWFFSGVVKHTIGCRFFLVDVF